MEGLGFRVYGLGSRVAETLGSMTGVFVETLGCITGGLLRR